MLFHWRISLETLQSCIANIETKSTARERLYTNCSIAVQSTIVVYGTLLVHAHVFSHRTEWYLFVLFSPSHYWLICTTFVEATCSRTARGR